MISNLDTLIRARLDDPKRYAENGNDPLVNALLAILELHKPQDRPRLVYGKLDANPACSFCIDGDSIGIEYGEPVSELVDYPCRTVRAAAKALGIEADSV